jgi:YbbR domain-containing protein
MPYHPFRNPGLKVLSVALAVLLWLAISRDQLVERSLRVPLEYQNIPEGLEIVGDPPGTVDVRVRGASGALGRLEAGEVVAVLDLQGARPGARLFHLLTDQVRSPFGIQVAQISPPTVSLEFERTGQKAVPVKPRVEGEPAPGYVVAQVAAEPASVMVTGPESRLKRLAEATTEPVSVQDASRPVRDVVTVGVVDSALRLLEARTATVTVDVVPAPIERTIRDVPVEARNGPARATVSVTPATVSVVVRGAREAVAGLTGRDLRVYVDLANLSRGRYVLPVKGDLGGSYGMVRAEPSAVEVRVR